MRRQDKAGITEMPLPSTWRALHARAGTEARSLHGAIRGRRAVLSHQKPEPPGKVATIPTRPQYTRKQEPPPRTAKGSTEATPAIRHTRQNL